MELSIHKIYDRDTHSYLAVLETTATRAGEDPNIFVVKDLPGTTGPDDAISCLASHSSLENINPCDYIGCGGGVFKELTDECLHASGEDLSLVIQRLSSSAVDICTESGGNICGFDSSLTEQTEGYYSVTVSWCISQEDQSSAELYPLYLPCVETFFKISNPAFEEQDPEPIIANLNTEIPLSYNLTATSDSQCFYISAFHAPLGSKVGDTFIMGRECYEILEEVSDYLAAGDGCELLNPKATGVPVKGPYSDFSECARKLGEVGSAALYKCRFDNCFEFLFDSYPEDAPDTWKTAEQRYLRNGEFNGVPRYVGEKDPNWIIAYIIDFSSDPSYIFFEGWAITHPSKEYLRGLLDCSDTAPGWPVPHPCLTGQYCSRLSEDEDKRIIGSLYDCAGSDSSEELSENLIYVYELCQSSSSTSEESEIGSSESKYSSSISQSSSSVSQSSSSVSQSSSSVSQSSSSIYELSSEESKSAAFRYIECPDPSSSGEENYVIIDECVSPCDIRVRFKTYDIPDRMQVIDATGIVLDTGNISTGDTFATYNLTDIECPVSVCVFAPTPRTLWRIEILGCGMDIKDDGGQIDQKCYEYADPCECPEFCGGCSAIDLTLYDLETGPDCFPNFDGGLCEDINRVAYTLLQDEGSPAPCRWSVASAAPSGTNFIEIYCDDGNWIIRMTADLEYDSGCWALTELVGSIKACDSCPPLGIPIAMTPTSGSPCQGAPYVILS